MYKLITNINRLSCFIDSFGLAFQANDEADVIPKSKWFIKSYIDYFFEIEKNPLGEIDKWLRDLGFVDDKQSPPQSGYYLVNNYKFKYVV